VLGPETLTVANLINNLGVTQSLMGRHGEAERLFRSAYETHRSLLGDAHRRTANVARNVGRALALQQRYIEALAWMDRAVAVYGSTGKGADVARGAGLVRAQRASVLFRLDRRQEAMTLAPAAVADMEQLPAAEIARRPDIVQVRPLTSTSCSGGDAATVVGLPSSVCSLRSAVSNALTR
jgi:tetratricopeptide (TPR) repeat protein